MRGRGKPALAPTVIPIKLGIAAAFLVRGRRDILVDTGASGSARGLKAALRRLGVEPGSLALVVITHGHADHFGGLRALLPDLECPVAVHAGDLEPFRAGRNPESAAVGTLSRIVLSLARYGSREPLPLIEPDIVLGSAFALEPYGVQGTVEHTPGHTEGSVSLFLGNGEAIIGDLLRGSMASRHSPRWPFVADDLGEIRRSVSRLLDQRPRRIWTSHGGPLTADAVLAFLKRNS
jgi:hydroxyacylglutathione hydrolase